METKGLTCKIPVDLHNQISEEIRETESTMSKFIEMIIREHYERGAEKSMGKNRTLAFQVSEELFQRVKEYLERYEQVYGRRLTQREFIIGLIEQALEESEEEFEAARATGQEEQAANGWESGEPDEDTSDGEEPENWDGGNDTPGASDEEDRDEGAEPDTAPETIETAENGTVTVTRDGVALKSGVKVVAGDKLVITGQPDSGYRLSTLTVNGKNFTSGSTYTVAETDTALTVAATFEVRSSGGGGGGGGGGVSSYKITVEDSDNGTVTSSRKSASKGLMVTLTAKADEGYKLDTITVTDKSGSEIKLTDKGDGKYTFTMPASAVTVKASFTKDDGSVSTGLPFTDVKADDWFYEAVKYAYDNKLMDGTASTTFAPFMTTNRAMVVTMLWRLEGQPKADATLSFTDVESGVWYTDAVNWAASKGIVKGYSDTVFAPNDTVTREQLATILYRYAESKGYDVSAKGDLTTFTDGAKTSSWATEAMEWAVGSKLLSGKGGNVLDPTGTATRAEVAQIFMNFAQNLKK